MTLPTDADEWPAVPGRVLPPLLEPARTGLLGARIVDDLASVRVGCAVWSSRRQDWALQPVGGIVIGDATSPDPETGELVRAWWVLNPYATTARPLRALFIRAAEVGALGAEEPVRPVIARLVARLLRQGYERQGQRASIDPEVAELVGWCVRLAGVSYS